MSVDCLCVSCKILRKWIQCPYKDQVEIYLFMSDLRILKSEITRNQTKVELFDQEGILQNQNPVHNHHQVNATNKDYSGIIIINLLQLTVVLNVRDPSVVSEID